MKRTILIILAFTMSLASVVAQTENPRGVYKLKSLIDKTGLEINAPFDQYKVCTDSVTLMVSVHGKNFLIEKNDKDTYNYTGEEPDATDSTKTRIFDSNAEHFTLKWWSRNSNHMFFPKNDWCTEYYVANRYSDMGKIVFDALMTPASTEVDKKAPIYGTWYVVDVFDEMVDVKKFIKEQKKEGKTFSDTPANPNDIIVITPEHMVHIGGRVYEFFSDGKTYFNNVKDTSAEFRNKITWLNPDLITVSVTRNNGKFTDYQLWHRIKSNVAPMSRIIHQYNSSRGF